MPFSLADPEIWASLVTLTALEIVLGVDNVVFISLIVSRLPEDVRLKARRIGIGMALLMRVLLLLGISWVIGLKAEVINVFDNSLSWRDIILIFGGLFLLAKGTQEIHKGIEEEDEAARAGIKTVFAVAVFQIALIDIVFSVDSIVTAIGIAEHVEVMIVAVVISMFIMYYAAGAISNFIERNPTTKMLALSFLLLIGSALVADGFDFHIPRGYIYFSMGFAAAVEAFNILADRNKKKT